MNVTFADIDSMMAELKRAKIKTVRLQTLQNKTTITYEDENEKIPVPHKAFTILVTARMHDEVWSFARKIALVSEYDDSRRMSTAKKHTKEAETEIRALLEKNKFMLGSGVYRK